MQCCRREAEASDRSGSIRSVNQTQHGGNWHLRTNDNGDDVFLVTDLFTIYTIEFPLVSTNSADMTREIVDHWVLKLGASNVLSSDQGTTFGGKTIQAISRVLALDETHTSL